LIGDRFKAFYGSRIVTYHIDVAVTFSVDTLQIVAVNTDSPRANVPGFVPNYITPKYGIANQAAVATSNYRA